MWLANAKVNRRPRHNSRDSAFLIISISLTLIRCSGESPVPGHYNSLAVFSIPTPSGSAALAATLDSPLLIRVKAVRAEKAKRAVLPIRKTPPAFERSQLVFESRTLL